MVPVKRSQQVPVIIIHFIGIPKPVVTIIAKNRNPVVLQVKI